MLRAGVGVGVSGDGLSAMTAVERVGEGVVGSTGAMGLFGVVGSEEVMVMVYGDSVVGVDGSVDDMLRLSTRGVAA